MEKRVDTIEVQLALVQQELVALRGSNADLPQWLKNSAMAMLILIFTQTITAVWWASEITANQNTIRQEVSVNTEFRNEYPKTQQDIMVKLTEIQSESKHMKSMLGDVKEKLRFVDIKQQHKEVN